MCAFFIRLFSVVWVVFSFEEDFAGKVSPYLIQPLNPFFRYFAQHIAEQITRFFRTNNHLFLYFKSRYFMDPKFRYFILIDNFYCIILFNSIFNAVNSCMSCFWIEKHHQSRDYCLSQLYFSGLLAPVASFPHYVKSGFTLPLFLI